MEHEIPEEYFAWLKEKPFADWSAEDKAKALSAFESIVTMSDIEKAKLFVGEIGYLLAYGDQS